MSDPTMTSRWVVRQCPYCDEHGYLPNGFRCYHEPKWLRSVPVVAAQTASWACPRCGSHKWVSASTDGGWTRRAQCVPCGRIHAYLGPGSAQPNPRRT